MEACIHLPRAFQPIVTFSRHFNCDVCLMNMIFLCVYLKSGWHNLQRILASKFDQHSVLKVGMLRFVRHLEYKYAVNRVFGAKSVFCIPATEIQCFFPFLCPHLSKPANRKQHTYTCKSLFSQQQSYVYCWVLVLVLSKAHFNNG